MRWLKKLFHFYLDASIHVALSVVSLMHITALLFEVSYPLALDLTVFFGTIVSYNFVKYGAEAEKYILVSNTYHKIIQIVSFLAFFGAVIFGFQLLMSTLICMAILCGLSFFYVLPVLPQAKTLRSLSGLKINIVALVWTGTTVLLPLIESEFVLDWDVKVYSIQIFLLVFVLILPFEIRDLRYDDKELGTLPQRIGIENTKILGYVVMGIFFFLEFLKDATSLNQSLAFLSCVLIVMWFLIRTKETNRRYFISFWVESVPIIWWLVIVGFGLFR